MRHIKLFEELTGKYKEETEIIYKDKNLVCLLPKSQMTSSIYGGKTMWCSTTRTGFDSHSKPNVLLFRFLFKDGYKLRLTYTIKCRDGHPNRDWADKSGRHVFRSTKDPFDISKDDLESYKSEDCKIISDRINSIPKECRENIFKFIEKNKDGYKEYINREDNYISPNIKNLKNVFNEIKSKYESNIENLTNQNFEFYINLKFIVSEREFVIEYSNRYGVDNNYIPNVENFKDPIKFEKRLKDILMEYKEDSIKNPFYKLGH